MLIDWFTVGAQIVNFLILVWLLKKLLYAPIVRAMDERENRIAARLAEAKAKEEGAEAERLRYQAQVNELEVERESLLAQMRAEVDRKQNELIEQSRTRVASLETEWRGQVERERSEFLTGLRRRTAEEVLAMTRRVVAELASADAQRCAVEAFLEKVQTLPDEARANLAQGDLCVRTEFALPEPDKIRIREALEAHLRFPVNLRFCQDGHIGLGLELEGSGWRIGWNSNSYLEALEDGVKEVLEARRS